VRPHLATLVADFRRHGSQIAVVTHRGNRRFRTSWAQLAELSARFAAELERRGIQPGDRVLLWGENSAEWIAAFFGCILRGVVAVPLDAAGSEDFARRVAADVQPKLVTGDGARIGRFDLPRLRFSEFAAALPAPHYAPRASLSRDSTLQIVFTSGTTAEPKGVVHTHGNVLASLDPLEAEIGKYLRYERLVHPLRFLHTLPLSHVFGQFMGLWVPPLIAAEVHYESRLEAQRIVRTIRRERISVLAAVPRALDLLRAHLVAEMPELEAGLAAAQGESIGRRWWRFRRLHRRLGWKFWALISGGATLERDLEGFWTTAGFALIQGYGMTETTALVTLNHPFRTTRGSIGKPLAGREIEIGPEGELLVRGASISERTWQNGAMRERTGGWLATGDLVTRGENGDLLFTGRKGDVIVTAAGLNLHPQDLETALRRQPQLRDALVVGYDSPAGPAAAAVLIPQPGSSAAQAEAAVTGANRELADFQQIQYWLLWPQADFPRTTTGKVLRRQVQSWAQQYLASSRNGERAAGAGLAGLPGLPDPLLDMLRRLQPAIGNRPIADSERLAEDLHLDSLAMVQLEEELESTFGAEEADQQRMQTVGDLRAMLTPASRSTTSPLQAAGAEKPEEAPPVEASRPGNTGAGSTGAEGQVLAAAKAPRPPRRGSEDVFPRWSWWPPVRWIRIGFLELVGQPLCRLLLEPRIGARVPLERPSLLVANHVTSFDAPILLYALRAEDRDHVAIAMSGEILGRWRRGKAKKHRIFGLVTPIAYLLVTALYNVFPLPRGAGLRRSFRYAGEALDRGDHVLVFPEGTRSRDGRLQPFEPGIGLLAEESQVPVYPMYLAGLGPLKLHERSWFRPGTVSVRIGRPLQMEEGEEPGHFARRLQAAVEELAALSY
jgi:long-chain acyl-CoA synthetase